MFERFTERARQVVVLAQDEARALRHNYIGTEHILLGLLREEEGVAARVLESLDITVEEVRAMVASIVGQGEEVTPGQIPFTPRAKKVLELSLREALSLGHNYIGTEHVLLGLARENEGVAARVLLDLDADAEKIRDEVIRMLSGRSGRSDPGDWAALEGYRPSSPPLADEVVLELERLRNEIPSALDEDELERAAGGRQRYAQLALAARRLERVWRSEDDLEEPTHRLGGFMAVPAPSRRTHGITGRLPRMPRRVAVYEGHRSPVRMLILGWVLFAAAFAVGVVFGWLIWA
jgi:ATP-dependent Clp protease ATP-binding subunit ClpA